MIINSQPWRFEAAGEGTHLFLSVPDLYDEANGGEPLGARPQVRPRIGIIRITTATGGNVMITTGPIDPAILYNKTMGSNADLEVMIASVVRGIFIEDLPDDGLVEVWHG